MHHPHHWSAHQATVIHPSHDFEYCRWTIKNFVADHVTSGSALIRANDFGTKDVWLANRILSIDWKDCLRVDPMDHAEHLVLFPIVDAGRYAVT